MRIDRRPTAEERAGPCLSRELALWLHPTFTFVTVGLTLPNYAECVVEKQRKRGERELKVGESILAVRTKNKALAWIQKCPFAQVVRRCMLLFASSDWEAWQISSARCPGDVLA